MDVIVDAAGQNWKTLLLLAVVGALWLCDVAGEKFYR
jgi:hypothetical protein